MFSPLKSENESTTIFSQLLMDKLDNTGQNLASKTKRKKSYIPIQIGSAASSDPSVITETCFYPADIEWNMSKSTIITTDYMYRESHKLDF